MSYQHPDGAKYTARLELIARNEGLAFRSIDDVTVALGKAGVTFSNHDMLDDAALADRLHILSSRTPALTATTTAGPNDPFRTWLGARGDAFDKLKPQEKLSIVHRYEAEMRNPQPSEAEKLTREMEIRYGSLDAARAQGTATEKLAIERVMPAAKPTASAIPPMPAAAMAASAGRRLVLSEVWKRMITITDQLVTTSGAVRGQHERELNRLVVLHPELRPDSTP